MKIVAGQPNPLRFALCTTCLAIALLAGCVVEQRTPVHGRFGADGLPRNGTTTAPGAPAAPAERESGFQQTTSHLRTQIAPLGDIEYNLRSMPLVSPDGRWIASETGIEPSMETITADLSASVPGATTITIYSIDPNAEISEERRSRITRHRQLQGGLLLGRSANDSGFLIESPQPDGSRWLGFANWESGEITWIARDEFVNAFGAIGPPGHLVWSRRLPQSPHFELVVLIDGAIVTYGEELTSWIYPCFTADGGGIFALQIDRENTLTVQFLRGRSRIVMDQSRREIVLSKQGSLLLAYRMMAAYPALSETPLPRQPTFIFDHPELVGVGVWRPLLTDGSAATLLEQGSTGGTIDASELVLYMRRDELVAQPLDNPAARSVIARGAFLPRRTASDVWQYLLFTPSRRDPGLMHVTGLNLLGLE